MMHRAIRTKAIELTYRQMTARKLVAAPTPSNVSHNGILELVYRENAA
jgi:hypothetical protein